MLITVKKLDKQTYTHSHTKKNKTGLVPPYCNLTITFRIEDEHLAFLLRAVYGR